MCVWGGGASESAFPMYVFYIKNLMKKKTVVTSVDFCLCSKNILRYLANQWCYQMFQYYRNTDRNSRNGGTDVREKTSMSTIEERISEENYANYFSTKQDKRLCRFHLLCLFFFNQSLYCIKLNNFYLLYSCYCKDIFYPFSCISVLMNTNFYHNTYIITSNANTNNCHNALKVVYKILYYVVCIITTHLAAYS